MEDSEVKRKRLAYIKLLHQYSEMGEEVYKKELDLGYCSAEDEKLRKEFESILDPSGFFVEQTDRIAHPCRDVYHLRVCRKLPIEMKAKNTPSIRV
jgi:hypothetical protein